MRFLEQPTRNLFFTGKGGVGKTSLACATAVLLADQGRKVLLVSTDPASNLDEVLGVSLGPRPIPVPSVAGLSALNINPEAAARDYRERVVGPYRELLPPSAVTSMEEQLSGSCTVEIAAFDEFARLLGNPAATRSFDHVVFDTAPTGHTLRLLSLPSAWTGFIGTNTTGMSCLGPLAGLQAQQRLYQETVAALSDPGRTTLVLVSRPDTTALQEAGRTCDELAQLGVRNQHLVINGVFTAIEKMDAIAQAMERHHHAALAELPAGLRQLSRTSIPLTAGNVIGIEALRSLLGGQGNNARGRFPEDSQESLPGPLAELIEELAKTGHGVILMMGKGGVGKTTVAAAVAVALAGRGFPVQLSTTDPSAHIAATLNGTLPALRVSRIDPKAETAAYTAEVMEKAGAGLDEQGQALLAEDLRSPCTEEIAVFRAFAKAVADGENGFVVLDTAPTGHTILLLDAALAYHREVTRQACEMPDAVKHLLPRLRDPGYTRVLIVTAPEATPVHEAAQLQQDLIRAGITPFAWVINQSLAPLGVTDPILRARRQQEFKFIGEVTGEQATRVALIPWQIDPPVGVHRLLTLTRTTPEPMALPLED